MPPHLARAWRATRYVAAGVELNVGRRCPDGLLDRLGARGAVLLTAWNPHARRMPEGWNRRMQHRLRQCLRRRVVGDAEGSLHRWHEAMVLVAGDPRPHVVTARRFRQLGVVLVRRGQKVRLLLLQYSRGR